MFQFRRFPSYAYLIQRRMTGYCPAGLPHSEIPGSMDICSSPRLIAACHVLRRLLMPRHSPCALSSLTCSSQSPLGSVSAFAKTSPAPLLLAFAENLFSARRDGVRILLRVVREFLVLFENYAGFTKIRNCMSPCILSDAVPQSICFVMLSHDASLLPYLLLSHCSVFKVQVSNRFCSQI